MANLQIKNIDEAFYGRIKALVQGLAKARIFDYVRKRSMYRVKVEIIPDPPFEGISLEIEALMRNVKEAAENNIDNFCILSAHKLVVPAMRALLSSKNDKIDAFLCPGPEKCGSSCP